MGAAIYMPMVPEAIVSMLACARPGLTHSVIFAGFSAAALRSRIDDVDAKLVITTDGQYRRGKRSPLKANVDEALGTGRNSAKSVEKVLVVRRAGPDGELNWVDGRDVWWHDTVEKAELRQHVSVAISPIAKPREINVVPELFKTRSGKIIRRLLRDVAEGRELGDTSALVDVGVRVDPRSHRPMIGSSPSKMK